MRRGFLLVTSVKKYLECGCRPIRKKYIYYSIANTVIYDVGKLRRSKQFDQLNNGQGHEKQLCLVIKCKVTSRETTIVQSPIEMTSGKSSKESKVASHLERAKWQVI